MQRCVYPAFQPVYRPGAGESVGVAAAVIKASGIALHVMPRRFVTSTLKSRWVKGRAAGRCCVRTFDGAHVIIVCAGSRVCAESWEVSNSPVSPADPPRHLHSAGRRHRFSEGSGRGRRQVLCADV
jgi:hypothetical protein